MLICNCKKCIISCTIFGTCNSDKFKVFILNCVATGFSKSVLIVWIAHLGLEHCVRKSRQVTLRLRIFTCEVCDELELQLYTCDVSDELALKTTKCAHEMFMVNWPWELQLYTWDVYDELALRTTTVRVGCLWWTGPENYMCRAVISAMLDGARRTRRAFFAVKLQQGSDTRQGRVHGAKFPALVLIKICVS